MCVLCSFNVGALPFCCVECKRGGLTGTKLVRCSRCKLARYCCAEHAKLHWRTHKHGCAALAALAAEHPSPLGPSATLGPSDGERYALRLLTAANAALVAIPDAEGACKPLFE